LVLLFPRALEQQPLMYKDVEHHGLPPFPALSRHCGGLTHTSNACLCPECTRFKPGAHREKNVS
jgi:hypothetical protein